MAKRRSKPKNTRANKIKYTKTKDSKRRMVQCLSVVNAGAVSREQINGVEHIVIGSYTLPDDIVMNDVLYPASEIEAGYSSLERTLAPVEHPVNANGEFISATDPEAIHNFHAGAFNVNVSRENGRVYIEKQINVQEALKTDRGKRLLDRINELETSEKPRPIHTSVGLFLTLEKLDKPQVNAAGDQYTMIGREFVFDHDAILLDSVGAATPAQGVGMAVNLNGQRIGVDRVLIDNAVRAVKNLPLAPSDRTWSKSAALSRVRAHIGAQDEPNTTYGRYHLWFDADNSENFGAYKLPFVDIVNGRPNAIPSALRNAAARLSQTQGPTAQEKTQIRGIIDGYLNRIRNNQMSMSYTQMIEQLATLIKNTVAADWMIITEVYEDSVIFETGAGFFKVPYTISGEVLTLSGIPVRVDKVVEYQPKINQSKGDEQMKKLILNALAKAGISTDGLSDDQLLEAYSDLMANAGTEDDEEDENEGTTDADAIANAISKAIKPLTEKVDALSVRVNADSEKQKTELISTIVNSKKYPGLTEEAAKLLPVETLKEMVANCTESHGVPFTMNAEQGDTFKAPAEMPE